MSSRLFIKLREDEGLIYNISCSSNNYSSIGIFRIVLGTFGDTKSIHWKIANNISNPISYTEVRIRDKCIQLNGEAEVNGFCEELGKFMGLYDDPYDKFGQLTYDMWRAIRLVVDTGMHYKGWSRDDAINLFLENTAKSQLDIENEVDRYIAWPGQALAYKIGQLKILELRQKSEKELGDKYDIKDFHHEILKRGSVPLDILEDYINEWIENTLDS